MLNRAEVERQHLEMADQMKEALSNGVAAIDASLQISVRDLKFLAQIPAFRRAVDSPTSITITPVSEIWAAFAFNKQVYDRIRWIDETGMERLQVDYIGGAVEVAPARDLQNRAGRYFFEDALRLNRGGIYISPLDLYVEGEELQAPYVPTVRFAAPIFDDKGSKRGILVLNYLAADLLHRFQDRSRVRDVAGWLVNQDGYWLRGPSPGEEFGFMFGRSDLTLPSRYPEVW